MRAVLVSAVVLLLAGCARRQTGNVAVKPTVEELPNLAVVTQSTQQASVKVQGREEEPRVPLVPSFEEPPLTPEEQAALGMHEPAFKLLLYPPPRRPGSTVLPTYGGLTTAVAGRGGSGVGIEPFWSPYAVRGWGGQTVGIEGFHHSGVGTYGPDFRQTRRGPDVWVDTAVDQPARKARAMYRSDK